MPQFSGVMGYASSASVIDVFLMTAVTNITGYLNVSCLSPCVICLHRFARVFFIIKPIFSGCEWKPDARIVPT